MGDLPIKDGQGARQRAAILWRSYQLPGYEACHLLYRRSQWHLEGTAVFSHEMVPCLLSYHIVCDNGWHTRSARVAGWLSDSKVNVHIEVDARQRWWMNKVEVPAVAGCIDLDLNFSPSTNTIAIQRTNLAVGEQVEVTAAWLRFPSFALEPLPQSYQRLKEHLYRYQSSGGRFVADLATDAIGLVTDYPGIWKAEALTGQ